MKPGEVGGGLQHRNGGALGPEALDHLHQVDVGELPEGEERRRDRTWGRESERGYDGDMVETLTKQEVKIGGGMNTSVYERPTLNADGRIDAWDSG